MNKEKPNKDWINVWHIALIFLIVYGSFRILFWFFHLLIP